MTFTGLKEKARKVKPFQIHFTSAKSLLPVMLLKLTETFQAKIHDFLFLDWFLTGDQKVDSTIYFLRSVLVAIFAWARELRKVIDLYCS